MASLWFFVHNTVFSMKRSAMDNTKIQYLLAQSSRTLKSTNDTKFLHLNDQSARLNF
jgi:hypothetical protein